jgi:2-dehydropantoate 2-reductase
MRIAILGAGGLGLLVGGRLAQSGVEVAAIARPQHVEAIRSRGLRISGLRGDAVVREPLVAFGDASQCTAPLDYLVVCVKARDTDAALAAAAPLRERTAAALSLQNWIGKDAALQAWIGKERTLGAATTEAGTLTGPGEVRHVGSAPVSCYFGELDGGDSERVSRLVDAFGAAGMPARAAPDIRQVEWEKLLQIASLSAWSIAALGEHSVAEGLVAREAAEYYVELAGELLAVYRSLGYEPADFFAPYSRFREFAARGFEANVAEAQALGRRMLESGVVGRTSMHEDVLRGRPSELDHCLGPFLDRAREVGLAVPTARATYRIIKARERLGAGG